MLSCKESIVDLGDLREPLAIWRPEVNDDPQYEKIWPSA